MMLRLTDDQLEVMLKEAYIDGFEDRHNLIKAVASTQRYLETKGAIQYASEDFEASVTYDNMQATLKKFRDTGVMP